MLEKLKNLKVPKKKILLYILIIINLKNNYLVELEDDLVDLEAIPLFAVDALDGALPLAPLDVLHFHCFHYAQLLSNFDHVSDVNGK